MKNLEVGVILANLLVLTVTYRSRVVRIEHMGTGSSGSVSQGGFLHRLLCQFLFATEAKAVVLA